MTMTEKESGSCMSGRGVISVCIFTFMGVILQQAAWAAIDCDTVIQEITPCSTYLTQGTPLPLKDSSCCHGVQRVYGDATTRDERRQTCTCIKNEAINYDLNGTALQNLPSACGLHLSFTITKDIDCST